MSSLGKALLLAGLIAVCAAISAPVAILPPPTMLEAALVVTDSVAYAWRNPDDACAPSTISFYQRMLDNDTEFNITISGGAGPLGSEVIGGLTPFTNYSIRVRYVCADGNHSAFSDPLIAETSQGMPSPPTIATIMPYQPIPFSALTITWIAPTMPNGVIVSYRVTLCEVDQPTICPIMNRDTGSPSLNYTATGLTPDTNYTVTLRAENGAIEALRFSDPDTAFGATEHGQSSAPTDLIAMTVTSNSIVIQWIPPAMPNGVLRFYTIEVYYSGQQQVENTTDLRTMFDITRLDPFTNYTIRVAGVNDFGVGNFSDPLTVQTLESTPSAPQNLVGVPSGATSAIFQWDPPAMPNGIITFYTLTTSTINGTIETVVPGNTTTSEVMGFDTGAMVTAQVTANTSVGEGPSSNEVTVQLPATDATPSVPRNLMAIAQTPTSIQLTWDEPLFIGNLTHYIVNCNSMAINMANRTIGTERNFTFTNLTPETTYSCTVAAAAGTLQGQQALVSSTTPTPALDAPMNVTATALSTTSIQVTWAHPMFMNTIDDYFVSWEPFGLPAGVQLQGGSAEIDCESFNLFSGRRRKRTGSPPCTDFMEFTITGLEEYINYNVSVIASNDAGNGTSGFDMALTLPAVPGAAPMNLQATSVTYNSISLGWDMIPFLYRNGPNFQYIVAYRVASSSPPSLTIAVTTNAATLQNLMPFTTYAIYVQGENSAGRGMQSTMLNITTLPAPPGPVSNIMVTPNDNGTVATITWTAPPLSPGNKDVDYIVNVSDASGNVVSMTTTNDTTVTVTQGLAPFLRYTVAITTNGDGGNGPTVSEDFYTLEGVPTGIVTIVSVDVVSDGLRVTFDPITDPNVARGNISYMVCYTTQTNNTMVCETTPVSPIVISVLGNELYNVTVTPFTVAGLGMTSAPVVADARAPGPLLAGTELILVVVLCTVAPVALGVVVIATILVVCIRKPA